MGKQTRQIAIVVALSVAALPAWIVLAQEPPAEKDLQFYKGKVVPLADLLAKKGVKLDADAAPLWLALAADDGRVYPLLKDPATRMYFSDAKLRNRPMRLTGKLVAGTGLLQVVNAHSVVGGKLHDIYYWCDICTIRDVEGGPCACCGAPLEFRETPVK